MTLDSKKDRKTEDFKNKPKTTEQTTYIPTHKQKDI